MTRRVNDSALFLDVAHMAIEAVTRPERLYDLCDLVAQRYDLAAFAIFQYNVADRRMPLVFVSEAGRTDDADVLRAALARGEGGEDEAGFAASAKIAAGVMRTEANLLGLAEDQPLPPNAFRDKVLGVTRGVGRTVTRLNDIGPFLDCFTTHDRQPYAVAPPPMAPDAQLIAGLLSRTLDGNRVVQGLMVTYDRLKSLFDRLHFGVAFVDSTGRLLTANRTFRDIAGEADALALASDRVAAVHAGDKALLSAAIARQQEPGATVDETVLCLTRRSGKLPLVVRAIPLRDDDVQQETATMLVVLDPEDERRLTADGLKGFGLLTPAEHEVCQYLVRGIDTGDIAERRGTSIATTRTQIKGISAKLACRSRLDILRLAMATASPLDE